MSSASSMVAGSQAHSGWPIRYRVRASSVGSTGRNLMQGQQPQQQRTGTQLTQEDLEAIGVQAGGDAGAAAGREAAQLAASKVPQPVRGR